MKYLSSLPENEAKSEFDELYGSIKNEILENFNQKIAVHEQRSELENIINYFGGADYLLELIFKLLCESYNWTRVPSAYAETDNTNILDTDVETLSYNKTCKTHFDTKLMRCLYHSLIFNLSKPSEENLVNFYASGDLEHLQSDIFHSKNFKEFLFERQIQQSIKQFIPILLQLFSGADVSYSLPGISYEFMSTSNVINFRDVIETISSKAAGVKMWVLKVNRFYKINETANTKNENRYSFAFAVVW